MFHAMVLSYYKLTVVENTSKINRNIHRFISRFIFQILKTLIVVQVEMKVNTSISFYLCKEKILETIERISNGNELIGCDFV